MCCTYVVLIRNYGGNMVFTTNPPFCLAYHGDYYNMKDPHIMTIHNPENYPAAMLVTDMVLHQLLVLNNPDLNCMRIPHSRCLLIPRGVHFGCRLFPEIVTLQNHARPYIDPTTRIEAPFLSVGPSCASNPLFTGITGDC